MNILENVAFQLRIRHHPRAERQARAMTALELMRMGGMADLRKSWAGCGGGAVERGTVLAGTGELPDYLARNEILVCLLPLTPGRRDILNADFLRSRRKGRRSSMPVGAAVVATSIRHFEADGTAPDVADAVRGY